MKSIKIILGLLCITNTVFGQQEAKSTKDSIQIFYDQLFNELEENYLYRNEVNWDELRPHITGEALKAKSFNQSLEMCPALFDSIKGDHTMLFSEGGFYKSTLQKTLSQDQFNRNLLIEYEAGSEFKVEVLDEHYGYIFIPGMLLLNAEEEELNAAAQKIYDAVVKADTENDIKGWIIDLRLNIGGNANVMLTGLYHLLGDGTTYCELDANKHITSRKGMVDGMMYDNHILINKVKTKAQPKPEVPVVLVSGLMTASAGEFVALGFRGRENTLIVGEESHALTTSNDLFKLPFNTTAALTLFYATDRSTVFTKGIQPDIKIVKEANFENLLDDKNIIEGIRFINKQHLSPKL